MEEKESKLKDIYELLSCVKKTGIALNEDQLKQIAEQEVQYIKEEVLPLLRDSIEPVLRKINRELTLVVGYHPEEPISVRISRDPNLADLEDAVPLSPDDIPDFHKRGKQQRKGHRQPAKHLKVTMDDGKVVFEGLKATHVFCEVLKRIGLMKVRGLDIKICGINIVSTSHDPNRQQQQIGNLYVFTNMNTPRKANLLKQIANRLNLSLNVEVLD